MLNTALELAHLFPLVPRIWGRWMHPADPPTFEVCFDFQTRSLYDVLMHFSFPRITS